MQKVDTGEPNKIRRNVRSPRGDIRQTLELRKPRRTGGGLSFRACGVDILRPRTINHPEHQPTAAAADCSFASVPQRRESERSPGTQSRRHRAARLLVRSLSPSDDAGCDGAKLGTV